MQGITSSRNPLIKEVKALKNRKFRDEKGLFFIEGIKIADEAIKCNAEIVRIFISEGFQFDKEAAFAPYLHSYLNSKENSGDKNSLYLIPSRLFKELSDTETPQGVLAVVRAKRYRLEDMLKRENLFVVLDSLQDPGNMGTIIRTADAAGFSGIIASKGSVDLYNPKVLRSTMGSVFRMPVISGAEIAGILHVLKSEGIKIYAAHLKASVHCFDRDMRSHAAIIIGGESGGVREEIAAMADELIKIPMAGGAESLNASVAAGILMYESLRQRLLKQKNAIQM